MNAVTGAAPGPDATRRVVAVGECMVELRDIGEGLCAVGYAGDTYNAAVYLKRTAEALGLSTDVGYLSGVGDDVLSAQMRSAWRNEGITDRSVTVPGRRPGMYAVHTDAVGERHFTYWRDGSAAATMLDSAGWVEPLDADLVHFSGITLQLMSDRSREAFLAALQAHRRLGGLVSFDSNFRPSGWSDMRRARSAFAEAARCSDIVLATFDDETTLMGDLGAQDVAERYRSAGAREVVVKLGREGALVMDARSVQHVAATPVEVVVDTTAAGDSFAGAYLAARLAGLAITHAARIGADTAAHVVQAPGAIVPRPQESSAGARC